MKRILILWIFIITYVIVYSQTVTDYSRVLQANGYTLCNHQIDNNSVTFEKFSSPSYVITIQKNNNKIVSVSIVAVLSQVGKYSFSDLEPVKLYPQYFDTPQIVNELILHVEPFEPIITVENNFVIMGAVYMPRMVTIKE